MMSTNESQFETTTDFNDSIRARINLNDIKNFVNNSVSQELWKSLPKARKLGEDGDEGSCPILKTNNTLALLIPGWEGIPTNIVLNILLSAILLSIFSLLIRRVYRTEQQIGVEYKANQKSSDWIHFIYGKRGSNQINLNITKEINRDHPNAYLPVVLHKHIHLIKGKLNEEEDKETKETALYRRKVGGSQLNLNDSNDKEKDNLPAIGSVTIRSKSNTSEGMDPKEAQQVAELRSVLWDEDISEEQQSFFTQQTKESATDLNEDKRFIKWLTKYMFIKDEDILRKRGWDALQYLMFQRYILYFLTCLTIICMIIILPINLYGDRLHDIENSFYRKTTILNIKQESNLVYIHSLMTIILVAMGIYLMRSFSQFVGKRVQNIDKRILLIENIPQNKRYSMDLKEFFVKPFPNVIIKRISFVYNVNQLTSLMMSLFTSIEAKSYCRLYLRKYGQRCEVRPYCLGNFRGIFGCCICYPKIDGLRYYSLEKKDLEKNIDEDLIKTTANPQGLAFVVFENEKMASEVHNYFKRKHCHCYTISSFFRWILRQNSDPFDSSQWYVTYAPYPDDVDWTDIATSNVKSLVLNISMNLIIFIIFFFISTPTSALNILKYITGFSKVKEAEETIIYNPDPLTGIFWSYIPTLGYTLMTGILPVIIKGLTTLIPFRTKSDYNHSIMYKSYLFLILMVLILPSLEIITVFTLFESQLKVNGSGEAKVVQWSCLFPAENGAFFLNYVLTSAFVGNVIEIIRISELGLYIFGLLFYSRTSAEYLTARQSVKFEFYFGTYYPRILLLVTLIITFSVSNPLIAPIGLFYLLIKHLVDRYLIYHLYVASKINQRIHSKAILFVYFALLFLLLQVYTHLSAMNSTIPAYLVGITFILHFLYSLFELFWDIIYFL